ncbi:MAG: bifunctional diaminohydroxyphosphoribosylaminopyrimidine deaminase/5-amino-6-(5-phosphoribosylamino)uracil reductase RibD [Alphaproteobacteria bacterium]|nr:bifunctional diaminohydroxyphosphoribosylaminopyrimidine deaminase/5-amino-6-(5-phosphoribosylamino)uracil reductase RibD [Alphaproteobacteria bacterium]
MISETDKQYMRQALNLAHHGLGRVWPNPSVGCVIVKNGVLLAAARTADGGRPHAETIALEQVGKEAKGATVYVTLEPCAHTGKTPPCALALAEAGVSRVVIASEDPDSRVNGKGTEILKAAGIDVTSGVLEKEARELNKGFFLKTTAGRPLITLKTACSLDGKTALANGQSKWITGALARRHVQNLRARHDAVLAGIGTVKADNPLLTARVDGIKHKTVRVILDTKLTISLESQLVKTAKEFPLWIFHTGGPADKQKQLTDAGAKLFQTKKNALAPVMKILAVEGITRLFVEGGATVHTAFLKENLYDELYIYRAPVLLGGEARPAFGDLELTEIIQAERLYLKKTRKLGQDLLEIYTAEE